MDVVFLDANGLFSAAYRPDAGIRELWQVANIRLVTSIYAAEEARRNLDRRHREDLEELLDEVELISGVAPVQDVRLPEPGLPNKDLPIFLAAIHAGAMHLLTGDFRHFGAYYGRKIEGILILSPADYLRSQQF